MYICDLYTTMYTSYYIVQSARTRTWTRSKHLHIHPGNLPSLQQNKPQSSFKKKKGRDRLLRVRACVEPALLLLQESRKREHRRDMFASWAVQQFNCNRNKLCFAPCNATRAPALESWFEGSMDGAQPQSIVTMMSAVQCDEP